MIRATINGFGRIGRLALRVWIVREDLRQKLDIIAINTSGSMSLEGWATLLKYDTAYGTLKEEVNIEEVKKPEEITDQDPLIGYLLIQDKKIPILAQRDPSKLPWGQFEVNVVIESTGKFRTEEDASLHLKAGAKKVLLSAPGKGGAISTHVLGINEYLGNDNIADNASCTTNCVAPVAAILHSKFGIQKATMTTIHGYTDDQRLQDNSHKDLRRARAAALNIIPTTTGAAVSTTKTIPELKGLFDGIAVRVPVIVGSISDVVCLLKTKTSVEEVNQTFKEAIQSPRFKGIVAVNEEPLVSSDIIGRSESAIVDLSFTQVIDGDLVKILAWYDNEWGYANRLLEQTVEVGNK
jgi:glyceraldehyde-3-phosphate dehydrogenase type I